MEREAVKMCTKCHTLKLLILHRTLCRDCNLERKRAVAAAKQATPEGAAANRQKAAAYRSTLEGREYMREFVKQPEQREKSNARARAAYVPNPRKIMTSEEKRAHLKTYRAKNRRENYAVSLHREIRNRAGRRGLLFDLEVTYFENALATGKCELSGLAFQSSDRRGPFSMSVDKIRPGEGYVSGNVRAVLWCLNAACGDWGLETIRTVMRAVEARAIVDAASKTGV